MKGVQQIRGEGKWDPLLGSVKAQVQISRQTGGRKANIVVIEDHRNARVGTQSFAAGT